MNKKVMHKKSGIKALTIRKLPEEVADAIQKRSEEANMSLSKALITLLQENLAGGAPKKKKRDLHYITGSWNEKEYREFMQNLAEQRKIDPKMWK